MSFLFMSFFWWLDHVFGECWGIVRQAPIQPLVKKSHSLNLCEVNFLMIVRMIADKKLGAKSGLHAADNSVNIHRIANFYARPCEVV
ncbi:MAG: hypothetical protein CSA50_05340 [Gammaproteobacteria bacterium]|nr:MAG: hypothetical protein CSA50_05340 [Gammaproteobacteria bacterium]